jgi:hypothetical protein
VIPPVLAYYKFLSSEPFDINLGCVGRDVEHLRRLRQGGGLVSLEGFEDLESPFERPDRVDRSRILFMPVIPGAVA